MTQTGGRVWLRSSGGMPSWAKMSGLPQLAKGASVGANDAVIPVDGEGLAAVDGDGDRGTAWIWNWRAAAVLRLTPEQLEGALRREGLAAAFSRRAGGQAERIGIVGSTGIAGKEGSSRVNGISAEAGYSGDFESAGTHGNERNARETEQSEIGRRFVVRVLGMEAIEVRRVADDWERQRRIEKDLLVRLGRTAARALYVLGLDMGTVVIEVDGSGRNGTIRALTPRMKPATPDGVRNWAETARAFAQNWAAEGAGGVRAKLGADPEFVLLTREGRIVPASRYFPPGGEAGSDSLVIGGELRWPLAELRPAPASEPDELATRMRRLLAAASRRAGSAPLVWRAGAIPVRGFPLGGHLHLSGAPLTGERLRALDNAVALPLRLLEPPGAERRRPRYGSLGDARVKPHGGFEYRTPPSWLVSPRLARGVLALAKVAAEHARQLAGARPLDAADARAAFYGAAASARPLLAEAAETVYAAVARTEGYRKYAGLIDPLFAAIRAGRTWNEAVDLRDRWGIRR